MHYNVVMQLSTDPQPPSLNKLLTIFNRPASARMDAPGEPILQSPAYIKQLYALVHDEDTLWQAGYVVEQLSPKDIARKRRCQRCHRGK